MEVYRAIIAYPWHDSGTLGDRIDAFNKRDSKTAIIGGGPGIDDGAGDEPPDDVPCALPDDTTLVSMLPAVVEQGASSTSPPPSNQQPSSPVLEPPDASRGMDAEQAGPTIWMIPAKKQMCG